MNIILLVTFIPSTLFAEFSKRVEERDFVIEDVVYKITTKTIESCFKSLEYREVEDRDFNPEYRTSHPITAVMCNIAGPEVMSTETENNRISFALEGPHNTGDFSKVGSSIPENLELWGIVMADGDVRFLLAQKSSFVKTESDLLEEKQALEHFKKLLTAQIGKELSGTFKIAK